MATLKRADLRDAVHHEIGLPRNEAAAFVDTVIEAVAQRLSARREAGEDLRFRQLRRAGQEGAHGPQPEDR